MSSLYFLMRYFLNKGVFRAMSNISDGLSMMDYGIYDGKHAVLSTSVILSIIS